MSDERLCSCAAVRIECCHRGRDERRVRQIPDHDNNLGSATHACIGGDSRQLVCIPPDQRERSISLSPNPNGRLRNGGRRTDNNDL